MAPWEGEVKGSLGTIEFEDSAFGIGFIQDGLVFSKANEQAVEADAIELASDAVAELMSGVDESIRERAALHANRPQVMFDVGGRLSQVEGWDVIADLDALVEGFEALEMEGVAQFGLADKNEGEGRSGVHVGVEPEAQFVQQAVAEQVSFVDDDQGATAALGEVGQGVA